MRARVRTDQPVDFVGDDHLAAKIDQIEIQRPRAPAVRSVASEALFYLQQQQHKGLRIAPLWVYLHHSVREFWKGGVWPSGGRPETRNRERDNPGLPQCKQNRLEKIRPFQPRTVAVIESLVGS